MAECPHCRKKLHPWNIRAECPHCGSNIPNYNWEERLEEDAFKREESFFKMHTTLTKLKFAVCGNPLRIARFACSFLPVIGYILPVASFTVTPNGEESFKLGSVGLVSVFTGGADFGRLFSMLSDPAAKTAAISGLLSLGLFLLSLLLGVIAFFLIPIAFNKPRTSANAVLHLLSTVLYCVSPYVLMQFCSQYVSASLGVAEASYGWGVFIGAALFLVAFVLDVLVSHRPLEENDGKYIPTDELQREYAVSVGAIKENEFPKEKKNRKKKPKE